MATIEPTAPRKSCTPASGEIQVLTNPHEQHADPGSPPAELIGRGIDQRIRRGQAHHLGGADDPEPEQEKLQGPATSRLARVIISAAESSTTAMVSAAPGRKAPLEHCDQHLEQRRRLVEPEHAAELAGRLQRRRAPRLQRHHPLGRQHADTCTGSTVRLAHAPDDRVTAGSGCRCSPNAR
jgi:hypothetical protein